MKTRIFQRALEKQRTVNQFIKKVREDYVLKAMPKYQLSRSYYDTFDWRLYRQGMVLEQDLGQKRLCAVRPTGESGLYLHQEMDISPGYLGDFPSGHLREALEPVISVRALLKLGELQVEVCPYELRDARGKIRLVIVRENYLSESADGVARTVLVNIRLLPYRGYEKTANKVFTSLNKLEPPGKRRPDPLHHVLEQSGRTVLDYSSKLNITLTADQTIGEAMVTALLFLLDILERNLNGIISDIDTEFLHDFRIAGRRSRSLFTQVKGIFPAFDNLPFKDAFAQLSIKTSENRDMDVFLQDMPQYQSLLPPAKQQDLDPLRNMLLQDRTQCREALVEWLETKEFRDFLVRWREFLRRSVKKHSFEQKGMLPVLEVANHSIWKIYKRLKKQGREASRINTNTFEPLHEVRKTAKKLRYLLETFRSLYPREEIESVIMQLKRLQNLLGSIVDYHVQQSYLSGWLGERYGPRLPVATNEAIKTLVFAFSELEIEACKKFESGFNEFYSSSNRNSFKSLFKPRDE